MPFLNNIANNMAKSSLPKPPTAPAQPATPTYNAGMGSNALMSAWNNYSKQASGSGLDPNTTSQGMAIQDALSKSSPQRYLQNKQIDYAKQFRAGIPGMEQQMASQLTSDTNNQLQGDLRGIRTSNSSRGLLYGGINAGQEAGQRNQAQRGLLSGISNINSGVESAANDMDQKAAGTAIGIQQQAQSMQNQIYQNAMAKQAGQNQVAGSLMSAGLMAGMLYFGGPAAAAKTAAV